LVINGRTDDLNISEETRQRVLDAVRELGYVVNPVARNLAGGRTRLIGVYTFESVFPIQHRDFYHPFLLGIEEECETRSHDLVLFTSATDSSGRRHVYRDGINRLRLGDGAVLLGRDPDREELARLAQEQFPFVFIGRREVGGSEISHVTADYAGAMHDTVDRLLALGHRRLAFIGDAVAREADLEREAGFRAAVRAHRELRPSVIKRVRPDEVDASWLSRMLDAGVTGFFVEQPETATRMRTVARRLGTKVPDDFSIATLVHHPTTKRRRGWSGISVPGREMGRLAVGMLIDMLESGDTGPHRVVVPCPFIVGATIGPAPGRKPRLKQA
jgi:DNA-binding LacI/PurR family transcriptional regulator